MEHFSIGSLVHVERILGLDLTVMDMKFVTTQIYGMEMGLYSGTISHVARFMGNR